jgi:hypothetical protein
MSPAGQAVTSMQLTALAELQLWEALQMPEQTQMLIRQVMFVYDCGVPYAERVQPGAFRAALIDVCARADAENRLRLSLGFPELVTIVTLVEHVADGVDRLVKLLERKA